MAQKKKDFTQSTAAILQPGGIVSRIITPQAAPDAQAAKEHADAVAMFLPKKQYAYKSKDGSEVRVTFMLSTEHCRKLRAVCYNENCKQKHVIDAALQMYFADYEQQHGKAL